MTYVIVILGVILGIMVLFRNKINKIPVFDNVKTISCERRNDYTDDFQYSMIYLYIIYALLHLVDKYGKDGKYTKTNGNYNLEIYLNTKSEYHYSMLKNIPTDFGCHTELRVILDTGTSINRKKSKKYDVVISTKNQEILMCKNAYFPDEYLHANRAMRYIHILYFGRDIAEALTTLISEVDSENKDDEFFKAVSILDYYAKGDFENRDDDLF
mgnify:CR=1 FL=1